MPKPTAAQSTADLPNLLRSRLAAFSRQRAEPATARQPHHAAAVVIGVTEVGLGAEVGSLPSYSDWCSDPAVLLTRRSARLRNHPGQWAFPGGRVDPGETLVQAALRELSEEVGLTIEARQVLGHLDDFATQSGFVMSPVVVWLGAASALTINPDEVASAHRVPFSELLRDDAPRLSVIEDSEHPVLRMPIGEDSIAAPTAAILYQFAEVCLRGRDTRVAHYSQPHFARR